MGTYRLKIWLDPDFVDSEVQQLYMTAVFKHNNIIKEWKRNDGFQTDVDAGFDLFVPETKEINRVSWAQKINHGVKTSMTFKGKPVSYYMYSRSSTPIKTPLRLANSVGIIDAQMPHTIQKGDRLVQICSPNMTYPLEVELINSEDQFLPSMRGTGGFGSTG
jgi:dUTP pyrophosphatase